MDFSLDPDTDAVRSLATSILVERSTPERLTALDRSGTWLDADTYRLLAEAGLLGLAVPESHGGAGLGFLELHHVLEQVGATAAQIPVWETAVVGALTLVRHGTPEQQESVLPGVAAGETLLSPALVEPCGADPRIPSLKATPSGEGWQLTGVKTQVPLACEADLILVSATTETGDAGVFLLNPRQHGVIIESQHSVTRRPVARLVLDGVHVGNSARVGGNDGDVLDDVLLHAGAGLASLQSGVCAAALKLAADYTSIRKQFGRPIASFQAVGQRLADAYIDAEAVRLTALQAAWRLSAGLDAADAVAIARWWAAEAGHKVLHAAHHVHGGAGIDLDYPLHRWFRLAKHVEYALGPATPELVSIGARLAADPTTEHGSTQRATA